MFSASALSVFVVAALGLLLMPGPAVIYIVTRSVTQGRRAGLATVLGIEVAGLCHAVAAAFGLSAILLTSAVAFRIVRYAGAAYLLYLGVRALVARERPQGWQEAPPQSDLQLFRGGLLVNLLNPKTALFFYAFLPQFVDPARGSPVLQILLLGVLFVGMATCTDGTYALIGSGVGRLVTSAAGFQRVKRYLTGGIYVALGAAAAIAGAAGK